MTIHLIPVDDTIDHVKLFIRNHPGCTINEICAHVKTHYTESSKISSLRQALSAWETEWCDIRKEGNRLRYYRKDIQND